MRNIAIYRGGGGGIHKYPVPYFSFVSSTTIRLVPSFSLPPTTIPLADIITGYEANGWSTLNETARPLTYHRERLVQLVHRGGKARTGGSCNARRNAIYLNEPPV